MAIVRTLERTIAFGQDAAGLEKTLRFLQALAQIVAVWAVGTGKGESVGRPWGVARRQLALGRRYLRFFNHITAFKQAWRHLQTGNGVPALLAVGKWSCLGMYLFLESCTILDAMDIHQTPLTLSLHHEGQKFWFYSLLFSLTLTLLTLLFLPSSPEPSSDPKEKQSRSKSKPTKTRTSPKKKTKSSTTRTTLISSFIVDICDLCIPGAAIGWIGVGPGVVGCAAVISTVLGSGEIWRRLGGGRAG